MTSKDMATGYRSGSERYQTPGGLSKPGGSDDWIKDLLKKTPAGRPDRPLGNMPQRRFKPRPRGVPNIRQPFGYRGKAPMSPATWGPQPGPWGGGTPYGGLGGLGRFLRGAGAFGIIIDALLDNPVLPLGNPVAASPGGWDWTGWTLNTACNNAGTGTCCAHDVISPTHVSAAFNCGIFNFGPGDLPAPLAPATATSAQTWHRITASSPFPYNFFPGQWASIDIWGRASPDPDGPPSNLPPPPVLARYPWVRYMPHTVPWGLDPFSTPPGQFTAPPEPLPHHLIPKAPKHNPQRSESEQSHDDEPDWNPKDDSNSSPEPAKPVTETDFPNGEPPHLAKPPGKGVKERKGWKLSAGVYGRVFGEITEFSDFITALYDAIPCETKGGKKIKVRDGGFSIHAGPSNQYGGDKDYRTVGVKGKGPLVEVCAFVPKRGLPEKAKFVYENLQVADMDQALKNLIYNHIEDYILGKIGGSLPKGAGFGIAL